MDQQIQIRNHENQNRFKRNEYHITEVAPYKIFNWII